MEYTYTNLDSIAYYTHHTWAMWYSLLLLGYKPVQHVAVLSTVGNWSTMVSGIILYYNILILWDHCRICGPSLTETSLCGSYLYTNVRTFGKCVVNCGLLETHRHLNGENVSVQQPYRTGQHNIGRSVRPAALPYRPA
jgi:hypothetical protein